MLCSRSSKASKLHKTLLVTMYGKICAIFLVVHLLVVEAEIVLYQPEDSGDIVMAKR